MKFRNAHLPNGLQVVAECNDDAHSTALGFFVQTGARDESDEVAGVSHFLEHMVFKGTARRSADDVNREFDELGAHYNAFTSEENTVYYAAVLPEYLEPALDLLADIMRPALREDDFGTEKQVIIEEIRMYDDQPPFGADEKCRAAHFGTHPLGKSVLGTVESIQQLKVDQMRAYFDRRYSPANVALVGAGKIDFEQLVAMAEKRCGSWPKQNAARDVPAAVRKPGRQHIERASAAQAYAVQLAAAPGATDPDRYAAKVAATLLGDDSGSRLYWELVDPGHAEHASVSHYDYAGAGVFLSYLCCEPDVLEENLQRFAAAYEQAQTQGFQESELEQAKSKINSRVVLASEKPRGRLFTVGANWLQRQEYRSVKDDLDAVEALTVEDLRKVLAKYPLTTSTTVTVGPKAAES